jgi:hypothetical protein
MGAFLNWLRERIRKDLEIIRARKADDEASFSWRPRDKSDPGNLATSGVRGPANLWGARPGPSHDVRSLFDC